MFIIASRAFRWNNSRVIGTTFRQQKARLWSRQVDTDPTCTLPSSAPPPECFAVEHLVSLDSLIWAEHGMTR